MQAPIFDECEKCGIALQKGMPTEENYAVGIRLKLDTVEANVAQ